MTTTHHDDNTMTRNGTNDSSWRRSMQWAADELNMTDTHLYKCANRGDKEVLKWAIPVGRRWIVSKPRFDAWIGPDGELKLKLLEARDIAERDARDALSRHDYLVFAIQDGQWEFLNLLIDDGTESPFSDISDQLARERLGKDSSVRQNNCCRCGETTFGIYVRADPRLCGPFEQHDWNHPVCDTCWYFFYPDRCPPARVADEVPKWAREKPRGSSMTKPSDAMTPGPWEAEAQFDVDEPFEITGGGGEKVSGHNG